MNSAKGVAGLGLPMRGIHGTTEVRETDGGEFKSRGYLALRKRVTSVMERQIARVEEIIKDSDNRSAQVPLWMVMGEYKLILDEILHEGANEWKPEP
jgi:hypothetical protein